MSFVRLILASSLVVVLTACSGSGLGGVLGGLNPIGSSTQCDTGTQVQLADPTPGQTGVNPNTGQIIIVASGNSNILYDSYNQWYLTLTSQYGSNPIQGGNLTLVSDPTGPHPYPSDFYYASGFGQLPSGTTWNVQLNEQSANCAPVPLNSFST